VRTDSIKEKAVRGIYFVLNGYGRNSEKNKEGKGAPAFDTRLSMIVE